MDETTLSDAQATVADAVSDAVEKANEGTSEVIAAVIENAQERIDDAQQTAQQIADAATQTALMQQVEDFKRETRSWVDRLEVQIQEVLDLKTEFQEMKGQLAATATLAVSPQVPSSSIQAASDKVAEATAEVAEIIPNNLVNDAEENPAPEMRRKVRRWI